MQHIILCEGSTDYALLQYYMERANGWNNSLPQRNVFRIPGQKSRMLEKNGHFLTIAGTGGSDRLIKGLEQVLERMKGGQYENEAFDSIVMITDHDEEGSANRFVSEISSCISRIALSPAPRTANNEWVYFEVTNVTQKKVSCRLLPLIIPFNEAGAMETFLLESIVRQDPYDAAIIKKCSEFVSNADPDRKYLKHRRDMLKCRYDVYFSVRTPASQFNERQDILRGVAWEAYVAGRQEFARLKEL